MRTFLYLFIAFCVVARGLLIYWTKARKIKKFHCELLIWSLLFAVSFAVYGLNLNTSNAFLHYTEFVVDAIIGAAAGFFTIRAYIIALKDIK